MAEHHRVPLDAAYDISALEFLNTLAYLKSYDAWLQDLRR